MVDGMAKDDFNGEQVEYLDTIAKLNDGDDDDDGEGEQNDPGDLAGDN